MEIDTDFDQDLATSRQIAENVKFVKAFAIRNIHSGRSEWSDRETFGTREDGSYRRVCRENACLLSSDPLVMF